MRLLTLFLLLAVPCLASVDEAKLLHAIAQVETGGHARRGRSGEVSEYQMMPTVWKQYRGTARQRAASHLRWLQTHLPNPNPYRLALAWNGGLSSVDRPTTKQRDYAARVVNLYND